MILCVRVNGADGGVAGVQQNLPLGGLLPDGRDSACSGLEAARSQGRELARRLPLLLAHPHPHRLPMVGEGVGGGGGGGGGGGREEVVNGNHHCMTRHCP